MPDEMDKLRRMAERPGNLLTVNDLLEEVTGLGGKTRYRVETRFTDGMPTFRRMGTASLIQGAELLNGQGVDHATIRALVDAILTRK